MDHAWLQEHVWEFYDGQLPPAQMDMARAHIGACASCQMELERWQQTTRSVLNPLRQTSSEIFVQDVMRQIRALPEAAEAPKAAWFPRWAFPALTLSMAGFAAAFLYVAQPMTGPTDLLFSADQEPSVSLLSAIPSEDQILNSVVENR